MPSPIGTTRAGDPKTLHELFSARFAEAIKTVYHQHTYAELRRQRDAVMDEIEAILDARER